MPVGLPEFAENPENRCPVILLLDTSGSMSGRPIRELSRGVARFKEDVLKDAQASLSVELAIVTFGPVQLLQDFATIDEFIPPTLEPYGGTPMGEAIDYALDLLEDRKAIYQTNGIQYYRPWIWMITDGAPTDEWQLASQRLREGESEKKFSFFSVAVEGANLETLVEISPRSPVLLNGLDFSSMFMWLSASLTQVSTSQVGASIELPPLGWGKVTS